MSKGSVEHISSFFLDPMDSRITMGYFTKFSSPYSRTGDGTVINIMI